MKRIFIAGLVLVVSIPFYALAASHEGMSSMDHGKMEGMDHGKMEGMDHGKMEGMDHGGMAMSGNMIMLGEETEGGVKAMAHLKDVKEAMAKMGMPGTHHFMVMFSDVATGKPIDAGKVAVKIEGPNDFKAGPIELMGMQGHFGADISLPGPGKYEFKIGSKLADGKKRQFEFYLNN